MNGRYVFILSHAPQRIQSLRSSRSMTPVIPAGECRSARRAGCPCYNTQICSKSFPDREVDHRLSLLHRHPPGGGADFGGADLFLQRPAADRSLRFHPAGVVETALLLLYLSLPQSAAPPGRLVPADRAGGRHPRPGGREHRLSAKHLSAAGQFRLGAAVREGCRPARCCSPVSSNFLSSCWCR